VRRITVPPKAANKNRIGVEAGFADISAQDGSYCNSGCGGAQQLLQYWPAVRFSA